MSRPAGLCFVVAVCSLRNDGVLHGRADPIKKVVTRLQKVGADGDKEEQLFNFVKQLRDRLQNTGDE